LRATRHLAIVTLFATVALSAASPAAQGEENAAERSELLVGVELDATRFLLTWAPPVDTNPLVGVVYEVRRLAVDGSAEFLGRTIQPNWIDPGYAPGLTRGYMVTPVSGDGLESQPLVLYVDHDGGRCVRTWRTTVSVYLYECLN